MTVKKVKELEKPMVAHLYVHENESSDSLALKYGVSRRTINRVLVEMGVARTRRFMPKPIAPVVITAASEQPIPMQIEMFPEQSFIQKSVALFKRIIAKLFPKTYA